MVQFPPHMKNGSTLDVECKITRKDGTVREHTIERYTKGKPGVEIIDKLKEEKQHGNTGQ